MLLFFLSAEGVGAGHFYCQVPLFADQLMQRGFLALSREEEVAANVGTGVISNLDSLGRRLSTSSLDASILPCLIFLKRGGKKKAVLESLGRRGQGSSRSTAHSRSFK